MKRSFLFCLIITLLTLLAYSNSFESSFQYDDNHVIERNPFVKDPSRIPQFFVDPQLGSGIYTETSSYRPLLMATFALNHALGGMNVFGYHLLNFFLHLLCTLLVYFVILHIFRFTDLPGEVNSLRYPLMALFAALVFGLHPVQTESVTYINGRASSLTGLFFLTSFLAYMQYRLNGKIRYLLLSTVAYACALLVKETAITLFAILLLFNVLFPHGNNFKNRWLSLIPHFLLTSLYLIIRVSFFGTLQYDFRPLRPLYDHLLSQSRAWVHYLGTLVLPWNLNINYDFPVSHSILEGQVILSIFLLVGISLVIWRLSRSNRLIGFFALWFAITLLPTNSVIALEDLVCDRWLYLSVVGYATLLALAAGWIFQKRIEAGGRAGKIVFFSLCALVVELYGYSTLLRNFDWTSPRALWEDAVAKAPRNARAYTSLGVALVSQDRLEEGARRFRQAIALEPRGGQAYLNLGYVYSLQGDYDKAIEYYEQAIPLSPKLLPEIYNNLGLAYLNQGKMEESEKYLRRAIEIRPHIAAPHYNLGLYFEKRGDIDQAISYHEKANKLDPDYHLPYNALSRLYKIKGWSEKSQEAYQNFLKYSSRR
jgi:tetratricopeptide (TPR) repeat protein